MSGCKVHVSIDEKEYFWIVVENKKIANMNATREDICKISRTSYYNPTNICPRCREEKEREGKKITERSILYPGNSRRGKNKESGAEEWVCSRHWGIDYQRYNAESQNNIKKSLSGSRTGYLDPESETGKGNKTQKLIYILYGWTDLNEKNDNHRVLIDFMDKDGNLYQVKGRRYDSKYRGWNTGGNVENEWYKNYKDTVLICISEDGKIIEEIYKIPFEKEIKGKRKGIGIYKYDKEGFKFEGEWYEQYRVKDKEELKNTNIIWNKIGEDDEN